jgi:UDP-N-acetyl-D-mannosaminuronic acid dehydrogenase
VAHDPRVSTPTVSLAEAVEGADVVVMATNHSEFRDERTLATITERAAQDCLIVDPWNCWGAAQVFAYASELAVLKPTQRSTQR